MVINIAKWKSLAAWACPLLLLSCLPTELPVGDSDVVDTWSGAYSWEGGIHRTYSKGETGQVKELCTNGRGHFTLLFSEEISLLEGKIDCTTEMDPVNLDLRLFAWSEPGEVSSELSGEIIRINDTGKACTGEDGDPAAALNVQKLIASINEDHIELNFTVDDPNCLFGGWPGYADGTLRLTRD